MSEFDEEKAGMESGARIFDATEALLAAPDESRPVAARAFWVALDSDVRLALAKTAPKVAGPWDGTDSTRLLSKRVRRLPEGHAVASYLWSTATGLFCVFGGDVTPAGHSLEEAQAACDAELIRQGYVLDQEETTE
jgi:hypothetical protein